MCLNQRAPYRRPSTPTWGLSIPRVAERTRAGLVRWKTGTLKDDMANHIPIQPDPETGAVKPINCAVVPDGYKLLTDEYPTRPYVCPIRTCRRLCKTLHGLVAHFAVGCAAHYPIFKAHMLTDGLAHAPKGCHQR